MNETKLVRHGFALGKFMPPHAGHTHLLRVASNMSTQLTILVCSLPDDPIEGKLRVAWIRELFPEATVMHLSDMMPQEPKDHPEFWFIWKNAIKRMVPESIDAVFASERYGWRLAHEIGATFIPLDHARRMVPVSGTMIRHDPYRHWEYLPEPVRAHMAKRIVVVGPESVGKSTLVKRLAARYHTIGVEEYARGLFDEYVAEGLRASGEFRYEDLSLVAHGQCALEDSLSRRANRLLIADTDAVTTLTWSQYLYGTHEVLLERMASDRTYDLTLLLHPSDTRYVQDGQRIMSEASSRLRFTKQLINNLERFQRPYCILKGTYEARFRSAVEAIDALFR